MATKKKKTDSILDPDSILDTEIIAIAGKWPKVEIGTHLTVTKYENGVTILKWDDEQLLKEVQEAIASLSVTPAKPKKTKSKNE